MMAVRQDLPWIGEPLRHLPLDLFPEYKHPTQSATTFVSGSAKHLQISHDVLIDMDQLLAKIRGGGSGSSLQGSLKNISAGEVFIDVEYLLAKIVCSSSMGRCTQSSKENYASKDLQTAKKDSKPDTAEDTKQKIPGHEIFINIEDLLAQIEQGKATKNFKSCASDLSYKSLRLESHMSCNMAS